MPRIDATVSYVFRLTSLAVTIAKVTLAPRKAVDVAAVFVMPTKTEAYCGAMSRWFRMYPPLAAKPPKASPIVSSVRAPSMLVVWLADSSAIAVLNIPNVLKTFLARVVVNQWARV